MKNLEIMGVQEMDAMEMRNVDGGSIIAILAVVAYVAAWGAVGYSIGKGIAEK